MSELYLKHILAAVNRQKNDRAEHPRSPMHGYIPSGEEHVVTFFFSLIRSGFSLWANKGELYVQPRAKLTPEQVAYIQQHKEELLAVCDEEEAAYAGADLAYSPVLQHLWEAWYIAENYHEADAHQKKRLFLEQARSLHFDTPSPLQKEVTPDAPSPHPSLIRPDGQGDS